MLESEKQSWILKIEGQIGCGKNYETVGSDLWASSPVFVRKSLIFKTSESTELGLLSFEE